MEKVLKFINCKPYDFTDDKGIRHNGFACKCYDPDSKTIEKVKTKHLVSAEFGDEVIVKVTFSGRYVNYELAE